MTRIADARVAAELGAEYVGVVFAPSPRQVDARLASEIRHALGENGRRPRLVGVFADDRPEAIAATAAAANLDVVQLHGTATADHIAAVRKLVTSEVWGVVRVSHALPPAFDEIAGTADAVLLDTKSRSHLGGSGERFDWDRVADALDDLPARPRIVVAGGLTPQNVRYAIVALGPDVVDVSSGVEASPGAKDPQLMREFARAVREA